MQLDGGVFMTGIWLFVHLVGVIVWVGGMFFSLFCLSPAVADLQPQQRAPLMVGVLSRFFRYVGIAIVLVWISGLAMLLPVGMKAAPIAWHLMLGIGTVMTLVFGLIVAVHFRQAQAHVARADLPSAGLRLARVRTLVLVNLLLGLLTVAVVKLLA